MADVRRGDAARPAAGRRGRERPDPPRLIALAVALDVFVVATFALEGRRAHDEALDLAGWWQTTWPFLAGLVLGWLAVLVGLRRAPTTLATGLPVWVATVFAGMALRDMTGQGTALPFVVVASGTLAFGLLGWRVVAALWRSWRAERDVQGHSHARRDRSEDQEPVPDPIGTRELSEHHDTSPGRGVVPEDDRARLPRRGEEPEQG